MRDSRGKQIAMGTANDADWANDSKLMPSGMGIQWHINVLPQVRPYIFIGGILVLGD